MHFFHFYMQSCSSHWFAYNFVWIFLKPYQQIRNQHESLRFLLPLLIFCKNIVGHITTFCKLWAFQKIENVFSKCVLEFNFAPILCFLFSWKSQIRCNLLYTCKCEIKEVVSCDVHHLTYFWQVVSRSWLLLRSCSVASRWKADSRGPPPPAAENKHHAYKENFTFCFLA